MTLRIDIGFGILKRYGPSKLKQHLWDREFASGKWNFIDDTAGDCVYAHLEKYARKGSILDLGCGPGNTANELTANAYHSYLGVDISEEALRKARERTVASGRAQKNRFEQGDFLTYVPNRRFDAILFREALYHVPVGQVKALLDRYAKYLNDSGVYIVRLYTSDDGKRKQRPNATIGIIETQFEVLEKAEYGESGATVVTFRPRA